MIKQGTILRNRFNNEVFIFSGPLDDPEVAQFEGKLEPGGTNGGNGLVHVHPHSEERFVVKSGRLRVVVNGKHHLLGVGQSTVVPRGAAHAFFNASPGVTHFITEFRPAQQHVRFFANFGLLVQEQTKWFSAKGDPNLFLIALTLDAYRNHLYLAGPPIFLQKLLFAALAPVARLLGYRLKVPPR